MFCSFWIGEFSHVKNQGWPCCQGHLVALRSFFNVFHANKPASGKEPKFLYSNIERNGQL